MERPSSEKEDEVGLLSCWGGFKFKFPWRKESSSSSNIRERSVSFRLLKSFSPKHHKPRGGFKYDPLSYSQNFDDGFQDGDTEDSSHGFSSRFAAPVPKPSRDH